MKSADRTLASLDRPLWEQRRRLAGPGLMRWVEAGCAAIAAALLYRSLYGELPYHDVERFANQVNSGRYIWDIGHIFMQPATLLWHKYLGFGEAAETSQKHINTAATALAVGLFYALLQRLEIPRRDRVFATMLVIGSGSLITLAPSGHMKLLAFPFMNAALFVMVGWEHGSARGTASMRGLTIGAGLIAIAAAFLASAAATAPFAGLAVLLTRLRDGAGWPRALGAAALFGAVCGVTLLILACGGYAVFVQAVPSLHGLTGSVTDKADLKSLTYSIPASLARLVFGTVNNLVESPGLGAIGRAWIGGDIPSLSPYAGVLLRQGGPWLVTLVLLLAVYLRGIARSLRGAPCLVPVAFLCGAQTWTVYWGLNDPEHWFLLTVPTVLLLVTQFPRRLVRFILPPFAILVVAVNVAGFAEPYAAYPLDRYRQQISLMFTSRDLLIAFDAYSGGPSLRAIAPANVPTLMLDDELHVLRSPAGLYEEVARKVAEALAGHGRVVVFGGVLDAYDWNAPWGDLPADGVTKRQLLEFFHSRYEVTPLGRIAEIPAWELRPHEVRGN
jgi:hypothetical protein